MQLRILPHAFSVCRVADFSEVRLESEFCFIGKTDEERSLVCLTEDVPVNTLAREDGWHAFRVEGALDFSLTGILAELSAVLARNGIPIFALSTYNTDYILTKEDDFPKAAGVLAASGHKLLSADPVRSLIGPG